MTPSPLQAALLLTLAVAEAPAPESAPTPAPLAGCQAMAVDEGTWQYRCSGLNAMTVDQAGKILPSFIEGVEGGITAQIGVAPERTVERRRLGGQDVDLQRIRPADGRATAWLALLTFPKGQRLASCLALGEGAPCREVLETLAGRPWQSGAAEDADVAELPPLALAGRPVRVPSGCQGSPLPSGGGLLKCGPIFAAQWTPVNGPAEGERARTQFGSGLADRALQAGAKVKRDEVACRLGGGDVTCQRLVVEERGQRLLVLSALARAGGQLLFATCVAPEGTALQPPCALVFELP